MPVKTKRFRVYFEGSVDIEIPEAVLKVVDANWRKSFYDLKDPADIARHIAYAMVIAGFDFNQLDGFAHIGKDQEARITHRDIEAAEVVHLDLGTGRRRPKAR